MKSKYMKKMVLVLVVLLFVIGCTSKEDVLPSGPTCSETCAQQNLLEGSCKYDGCDVDDVEGANSKDCYDKRSKGYYPCCCKEESVSLWTVYKDRDAVLEVANKSGSHPFLNAKALVEDEAIELIIEGSDSFDKFISLLEDNDYIVLEKGGEVVVYCVNTSAGYECSLLNAPWYMDDKPKEINEIDQKLQQECEDAGGRYKCYGFCASEYERHCDFPFEDAGKSCTDNSQCRGLCIADDWQCESDCTGTCATYRLNVCDEPNELRNGVVYYEGVICD